MSAKGHHQRTGVSPVPNAARAVVQRLESLQRAGVTHAAKPRPATDDRVAALAAVAERVAACTRCAELVRTRTQTVFGVGNPHARLVFLGEAPGPTKIARASRSSAAPDNCSTTSSSRG